MESKVEMTNLKEIVEEVEKFGKFYRETDDKMIRGVYNNHIELVILEAPVYEQYNLCDYWERLKYEEKI